MRNRKHRAIASFLSSAIALCSIGCDLVATSAQLRVYDYVSKKDVAEITPSGRYREMLCNDVSVPKAFFTITQEGESLLFRKRDENGREKGRYLLPLLESVWAKPNWYSISPDGRKIAHVRDSRILVRNLSDAKGKTERSVFKLNNGGKRHRVKIALLAWLDRGHVVLVECYRSGDIHIGEICKIGMNGQVVRVRTNLDWSPSMRLSPNRKYICGVIDPTYKPNPDWDLGDQIMIFDCIGMKEYKRIPQVQIEQCIGVLGWSVDSRKIGFHELTGNKDYLYDLPTGKIRSVSGSSKGRSYRNLGGIVIDDGLTTWIAGTTRCVFEE